MATVTSEPYPPLEPAPKDFTLAKAIAAKVDDAGHYHVGKLDFSSKADYLNFRSAQLGIGGTKTQLAVLHAIETTGKIPQQGEMNPAPSGTTVDKLLDVTGQKPDAKGFYHLGNMQVHKDQFEKFVEIQKDVCGKNPEALNALYHMEHAKGRPLTYDVTSDKDRNDRYDPNTNTIHFNPNTAIKDAFNGNRVPPGTAAVHEETHWAGRKIGQVLQGIPYGNLDNAEEARVIEGSEARDMNKRGLPQRHSHYGSPIAVRGLDSITPAMAVKQNDVERSVHSPFQQSGRIMESKDGWTTIAIRGDGKLPEHQMKFKTEELSLAMTDQRTAHVLLDGAKQHQDTVTFKLTADGKMVYENPAQQQRLHDHPIAGVRYPDEMTAVNRADAPSHRHAEVGGR